MRVEDTELLRRYTEDDSEVAFTEFVRRHLNLVYFTALRETGGDTALAQDVAQTVFAVAARRAPTLIAHATLAGWLHTTTRYTAARAKRKERTRQRYEKEAAMHDMITGDSENDWARLRPVIDDALDDLSTPDREAILSRFFESRSFADLGATWRVSQDAARMRVDRSLDKLRVVLERRGIPSMSAALGALLTAQGTLAAPAGLVTTVSGAALVSAVAPGVATTLTIMSGTKIIAGTAAIVAALAVGSAVFEHNEAKEAALRVDMATRELAILRTRLARAEQRRSAAETTAAEAEKDNGALLAAVEGARTPTSASPAPKSSPPPAPNDPLAQTLNALFPNGIVATLGNRTITVAEVRRQITLSLPRVQQAGGSPEELRQRLYALQNAAIADLVTRQLSVDEFHNQPDNEPPKHIDAPIIDAAIADQIKVKFNNDQGAFLASLNAEGITLDQYRKTVEENIIYGYMRGQQRKLTQPNNGGKAPAP
jgi:RNA polymerase sigma factor (sigma-70 family)